MIDVENKNHILEWRTQKFDARWEDVAEAKAHGGETTKSVIADGRLSIIPRSSELPDYLAERLTGFACGVRKAIYEMGS